MRVIAALAVVVLLASCGSDTAEQDTATTADEQAVEAVVRASIESENDKDVDDFLDLWTNKGLESYDVGSRQDLLAGKSENFGTDNVEIIDFAETTVNDDQATVTVDVAFVKYEAVRPVNRLRFKLIEANDHWLMNGFEFVGGASPAEGAEVVEITADEYSYKLGKDEVTGNVGFKFSNSGDEAHEITLFKGPTDIDLDTAAEALKDVNGEALDNVPGGFEADHIAFAEPKDEVDVSFTDEIPAGTYILACYLPEGGISEEGEHGHESGSAPTHFELGMRALLTVK